MKAPEINNNKKIQLLISVDGFLKLVRFTLTREDFGDCQKGHGNKEIEEPIGRRGDAVASAPGP
jgi:hypothetical protein